MRGILKFVCVVMYATPVAQQQRYTTFGNTPLSILVTLMSKSYSKELLLNYLHMSFEKNKNPKNVRGKISTLSVIATLPRMSLGKNVVVTIKGIYKIKWP